MCDLKFSLSNCYKFFKTNLYLFKDKLCDQPTTSKSKVVVRSKARGGKGKVSQ